MFCTKCGKEIAEGTKFCPSCGAQLGQGESGMGNVGGNGANFSENFQNLNDTADYTNEYDPQDVEQNKTMAVLAYFGLLVLIPIFAAKQSKFARFHANQGLVLCIAAAAVNVVWVIFSSIIRGILYSVWTLWSVYSVISAILGLIGFALGIAFLVLMILGIINAASGKAKELPILGKIKLIK